MPKMKIKIRKSALSQLTRLEQRAEIGADKAMSRVVAIAERDAKREGEWHQKGTYSGQGADNSVWIWHVTGLARDSIIGSIISRRSGYPNLPVLDYGQSEVTRVYPNGRIKRYIHEHYANPSILPNHRVVAGVTRGRVSMYPWYASNLQDDERGTPAAVWGSPPNKGISAVEAVFQNHWTAVYVPLLKTVFERVLKTGR
jgi:hypothetical protein